MEKHVSRADILDALHASIHLSRQELQQHSLISGDCVHHDMFEGDLTVIEHKGALVHVEFYNPESQQIETAFLPIEELYYPDLAAGALILQLMS